MTRLPLSPTQRIDAARKVAFTYRGKPLEGLLGDTAATALFANGVRILSRSLKYHRPRGLYSLDFESANAMMEIDGTPNCRAELTYLRPGMGIAPQNCFPSPEWDAYAFLDAFDWAMPAGFFYKMFHRPYKWWPFFQDRIRKMAGLGKINPEWKGGRYENLYLNTDVCVVGGGPAGMSAALAAAEDGLRVILLEARPWLGGFYDWRVAEGPEGTPLHARGKALAKKVAETPNIRVFTHTYLTGFYSDNLLTATEIGEEGGAFSERYIECRAASVVVATGCAERPLIFEGNDRPGVMQAGCAHRLARTWGLLPGTRAVISSGHDLTLEAAADLSDLGVEIACVADCRPDGQDEALVEALRARNIPVIRGWVAAKAHGCCGPVKKATVSSIEGARTKTFECDLLVASAGLSPVIGPLQMAHAKIEYDPKTGWFLPASLPPSVHAAGRMLGVECPEAVEISGRLAGLEAARDCGGASEAAVREALDALGCLPGPASGSKTVMAPGAGHKAFVCFDDDVTVKTVYQACDQGFDAVELVKRYTGAGTGPSQGGIPGHNLPLVLSQYHGQSAGSVVPTTVRSPLVATLMATIAGERHDIFKRTPLAESQEALGGVFRRIGVWERARYFSTDLDPRAEIENVRKNVGMIDVSTLGKFRIHGPDALKALQRVYVSDLAHMEEGRLKYSAMCNDDGNVIDDGVIAKVAENDYCFTTSSARAGQTAEWIRYHTRFEGWDFHIVNLTDALGAINLAGPRSREVLARVTAEDVSNEAFPYMGFRELALHGGVTARAMRVGFVGELAYELHVPSSLTQHVWDLLWEAGREFGVGVFGVEAQNVLRLEKGHIIIGTETEIRTTLHDVHLGFLWAQKKKGTVGGPALRMTEKQEGRMKLVGFETENPAEVPKDGTLFVDSEIRGFVCTARHSAALGKTIGLGLVEANLNKMGGPLEIFEDGGRRIKAKVVRTPFYDPEGARLRS